MNKYLLTVILLILLVASSHTQENQTESRSTLNAEELKRANDPMAHIKTFNLHNYIMSSLYGMPEYGANQLMFRYAQPLGKFLLRGTLPVQTSSAPGIKP